MAACHLHLLAATFKELGMDDDKDHMDAMCCTCILVTRAEIGNKHCHG